MKKGILFLILFFLVVCKGTGQILQGYVKTLEEKPVSQAHVILLNSDFRDLQVSKMYDKSVTFEKSNTSGTSSNVE